MASSQVNLLPLLLIVGPVIALACGPFFYPAPPTLDRYPERLPVKTMRELAHAANPPPADAATFDQLAEETRAIAGALTVAPRDESLRRIDTTLARNRAGDYRKRFANCLYDFRDLLASEGVPAPEVQAYAAWRVEAMNWDDGFFVKPPPSESWQFTAEQLAEKRLNWQRKLEETTERLAAESEKASAALKPHWLVQAGVWQFKHALFENAAQLFQRTVTEAPEHPRAEIARLMLARAHMEKWRAQIQAAQAKGEPKPREADATLQEATLALDAYLGAHPNGRFAPDIPGWKGGLLRDDGQPGQALNLFLTQLDFTNHPEIVRRAVRECEACLKALDAELMNPDGIDRVNRMLPLEEIASRPLAALAVVYHFLDSESRTDFTDLLHRLESVEVRDVTDRLLPPVLRMRRAGREVLPALAAAVVKQKANYGGTVWRPRYLAILAWAASEAGEHRQAIGLCDLAGEALNGSDDLLFVRAVALQRAGDLDEAIATFRHVKEKFPQSPLNAETQFRIATALRDKHEAGVAVVELWQLMSTDVQEQQARRRLPADQPPTPPKAVPALHLDSEVHQWIDTLLQFAPLPELERGVAAAEADTEIGTRLREILRMRYLAREDFDAAERFSEPAATPSPPAGQASGELPLSISQRRFSQDRYYPVELSGAEWQATVTDLKRLTRESGEASNPVARAEKLITLADTWAGVRGRLTLPSMDDFWICQSDFYEAWRQRHRNASTAGLSANAAEEELELRDELRHAFRRYIEAAAAAPGTPQAAKALWRANDAIRKLAELSPWSYSRAFETRASEQSRQLHEQLLRECPTSEEATRLSVWWSFPPPPETSWMPGDLQNHNAEVAVAEAFRSEDKKPNLSSLWESPRTFEHRLLGIAAKAAEWDSPKLMQELAALRRDFLPSFDNPQGARVINHLDDLTLFLQEPGLTPTVRTKYFAARLSEAPPDLSDPEMQPWRDYFTFLALVRELPVSENPETGNRVYRPMSQRMREFLERFPKSAKREAALARLAIATVRETRVHTGIRSTVWPEAPKLGGYKAVSIKRGQPFDSARVFEALNAYERQFPNGRYAGEMRLWRGAVSIDAGDWKSAVNLLVATLDDQSKRDLHLDASLNLADIFMRLLEEPGTRQDIIAAIADNPSAQQRLHQFMYSETLGARLRCLEGYLQERFAAAKPGN